jgi:hypothetical protein
MTHQEFVGPLIEVAQDTVIQRVVLLLETFDPPPEGLSVHVGYKDNDTSNWHVSNLYWRVRSDDLIRAAEVATDAQLERLMPTLLQLAPVVADRFHGVPFGDYPDLFHTH